MSYKILDDIKKFIIRLLAFLLLLIALDRICGNLLKKLYFAQNHGSLYKSTYIFNEVNSDILIVGSSTARFHYIPKIFQDSLSMSCYNAGRAGNFIFYYEAVIKCVLKRYNPKIVILDIQSNELEKFSSNYDRLSDLLPYYASHPEIRDIIYLKSRYEKWKLLSSIYPYNSVIIQSLTGYLDLHNKRFEERKEEGFSAEKGVYNGSLQDDYYHQDIDSNNVKALDFILRSCAEKKIMLFITISPKYEKMLNQSKSTVIAQRLAKEYHDILIDNSQNKFFLRHPELFYDKLHLNENGANIYSVMIAKKVKSLLVKKTE